MLSCIYTTDSWGEANKTELVKILEQYYETAKSSYAGVNRAYPFNKISSTMEFRIFRNVFCELYNINKSAVAFDDYMKLCWEKYLVELARIRPLSWFFVGVILALNYLRLLFNIQANENVKATFAIAGCFILVFSIVTFLVTRMYEIKIMTMCGIETTADYGTYIEIVEAVDSLKPGDGKMGESELLNAITAVMNDEEKTFLTTLYEHYFAHYVDEFYDDYIEDWYSAFRKWKVSFCSSFSNNVRESSTTAATNDNITANRVRRVTKRSHNGSNDSQINRKSFRNWKDSDQNLSTNTESVISSESTSPGDSIHVCSETEDFLINKAAAGSARSNGDLESRSASSRDLLNRSESLMGKSVNSIYSNKNSPSRTIGQSQSPQTSFRSA